MSDFIRMLGMKIAHNGICNKCGLRRDKANHQKCDRWPMRYGSSKGFKYVSNSKESTLADLKDITAAICSGDDDATPVRFELKIMQTRAFEAEATDE